MASFIGSDGPDQAFLLPPDAREWLPAGHLAWSLLRVAAEIDLSEFVAAYRADGRSRPAYHPQAMLGLIMYCYCKGIRSSRAIEMATHDDLGARVIMGQRHPDHATIARFITRHREVIKRLLVQTLVIAAKDGMLRVDVVAGDGTTVKANASMASNVPAEQLEVDIAELERLVDVEVQAWFTEAQAADVEDALFDDDFDGGDGGGGWPLSSGKDAVWKLTQKLARRRAAKAKLAERDQPRQAEAQATADRAAATLAKRSEVLERARQDYQAKVDDWHARDKLARRSGSGGGLPGTRPVPVDEHSTVRQAAESLANAKARHDQAQAAAAAVPTGKASTTDPASRVMPAKHGGYQQMHNVQVIAEGNQLILHVDTHDNPSDVAALHPLLRGARNNLHAAGVTEPIGTALFDAGYASDDNFTTDCPDTDTTLLVAVTKEARQTGRLDDGGGRNPQKPSWQQMAARLVSAAGKTMYNKRASLIEPVFAQMFGRLGKYLNYRGDGIHAELGLCGTSHNLLKIIKHRVDLAA